MRRARATVLLATALLVAGHATARAAAEDDARGSASAAPRCALDDLPGLSTQFLRMQRRVERLDEHARLERAAQTADFWRVADTVLGRPSRTLVESPGGSDGSAPGLSSRTTFPCNATVRRRDAVAWEMGLSGYSAREIADVVSGHLTRAALDEALRRLMAGHSRVSVARFLEARWRDDIAPAPSTPAPAPARLAMTTREIERAVVVLAREFRVAPGLVQAVLAAESGGNPSAVSPAGAIGLMQLMPATAAALGVDPWAPLENLRGGIAYLSSLLHAYGGSTRLALIAYNAGPQHADRVRDGRAVAYRETRQYLDAIAARYPLH